VLRAALSPLVLAVAALGCGEGSASLSGLVGAYFREHPDTQQATVRVEDEAHVTMQGVPAACSRAPSNGPAGADPPKNARSAL
jgi:hypothetical protein